jgi:hypothetical protein
LKAEENMQNYRRNSSLMFAILLALSWLAINGESGLRNGARGIPVQLVRNVPQQGKGGGPGKEPGPPKGGGAFIPAVG